MAMDIRNVKDMTDLILYFSENLDWNIDFDDFDDIDDIAYDFEAEEIGLKEEAFAKISSLRQLQPLVDGQKWGIFCVEFDSNKFEVSALRKILSGLIPKRRNAANHAVWDKQDLLFICTWGTNNNRTIGIAHFEDKEYGLPQIKMISCAPALEEFDQIHYFEQRLSRLKWPSDANNTEEWHRKWSEAFVSVYRQTIKDSSTLTMQLADEARAIRDRIIDILDVESKNGYVHLLYEKFRDTLIHDMDTEQFADMYAQTVVYGLFSARCMDETQEDFSVLEAIECIPNTNPFLKNLMRECMGADNTSKLSFDELEIGNVVEILLHTKTSEIIKDFNRQTGGGREDTVIYFYEGFLDAYEKEQKKRGGVYYTPSAVVNFMVRSVQSILCKEFDIKYGLKANDTKKISVAQEGKKRNKYIDVPIVQVLDPATGTGTFLRQVIMQIYHTFKTTGHFQSQEDFLNQWNDYVDESLLPRINGYEIMMAPYAVAHMKLAMLLQQTGYRFKGKNRLNVFLTNALEKPGHSEYQMTLWSDSLATESIAANITKKNRCINVCIGNPPYNAASQNNGEWILELIKEYKMEPGGIQKLNERNPKWLNDDYVKFIRLCEEYISTAGEGVLAFINPHGFIDNPTFRGMRWNLLRKFDIIYILDLHGNSNRKEKCPDGSKDENVFDIQQGVSINFFIKSPKRHNMMAEVFHADLWGLREYKYDFLLKHEISNVEFQKVEVVAPEYNFKPTDISLKSEYEKGFAIDDLFEKYSVGIVTAKDKILINSCVSDLLKNVSDYYNIQADPQKVFPIYYRPLDQQYIYYDPDLLERSRESIMSLFYHDNIGLITARSNKGDDCSQFLVSDMMSEAKCGERTTQSALFPLYSYNEEWGRIKKSLNLNMDIVKKIQDNLGINMKEFSSDNKDGFSPEELLAYIYATLYSKKYRDKYKEFINASFPRVPYPKDINIFWKRVSIGKKLMLLHLMREINIEQDIDTSLVGKTIGKISYDNNTVYINKADGFVNIDKSCWDFVMCGYQPLRKWLKDRKDKNLTKEDVLIFRKMQYCIMNTISLMEEIDKEEA